MFFKEDSLHKKKKKKKKNIHITKKQSKNSKPLVVNNIYFKNEF